MAYKKYKRRGRNLGRLKTNRNFWIVGFFLIIFLFILITGYLDFGKTKIEGYGELGTMIRGVYGDVECLDWGTCDVDYNLEDLTYFNSDSLSLEGIEKRECRDETGVITIKRRNCDPTIVSEKVSKTDLGVKIFTSASKFKREIGVLPSFSTIKKTKKGIEVFAPTLEEEILVSEIELIQVEGISILNINIAI